MPPKFIGKFCDSLMTAVYPRLRSETKAQARRRLLSRLDFLFLIEAKILTLVALANILPPQIKAEISRASTRELVPR
jgi:hypothetical protein